MCSIELCLQTRWQPALNPGWRPPSGSGWEIQEIPAEIETSEGIRNAWAIRRRTPNRNGKLAVDEMARFLHANGIAVSKEVRSLIENQADFEWCSREPSRCHKRIMLGALQRGKTVPEADVTPPSIVANRVTRAPHLVRQRTGGGGGCCGGGRRR